MYIDKRGEKTVRQVTKPTYAEFQFIIVTGLICSQKGNSNGFVFIVSVHK